MGGGSVFSRCGYPITLSCLIVLRVPGPGLRGRLWAGFDLKTIVQIRSQTARASTGRSISGSAGCRNWWGTATTGKDVHISGTGRLNARWTRTRPGQFAGLCSGGVGSPVRPFARPPDRPETCDNHGKKPKSWDNAQKLPKTTKTIRKLPKSPSPVRPSLRAGQFGTGTRCWSVHTGVLPQALPQTSPKSGPVHGPEALLSNLPNFTR